LFILRALHSFLLKGGEGGLGFAEFFGEGFAVA
jgi:hypothetical protein